jgi:transcriptional regulator with XRE-family HTH domain
MAQTLSQRIAATVSRLLAESGRPQTALAAYLGVSQSMIPRRLKGQYVFPLNELEAIAAFFGVTVADLIGGTASAKDEDVVA